MTIHERNQGDLLDIEWRTAAEDVAMANAKKSC